MKKVLLVTRPICPPWDEASKNFAYYLALNIKDFEIHLLTNSNCKLPNLPENVYQEPVYTAASFDFNQKMKSLFYQISFRKSYDIIHYCFTPAKLNSFFIKNLIKNKKTKTIQTIATLREDLYSAEDLKKMLFADLIITYSDYSKNKLEKLGFNNVRMIYPGIDLNLYSPAPKDQDLMNDLGISSGDFVITYPGEYARLSATDDLAKILIEKKEYLKKNSIKFFFCCRIKNGDDQKKKEGIERKFSAAGMLDRIIFSPRTFNTLKKAFGVSDLVVYPVKNMSGKFDVPLAVIEAMACAKPLIISDLPIFSEFANEQNSVKIETGNMDQLFEKILDVYENKDRYVEIGKNARKYVAENFDIKKIAEKYQEIYSNL
jgi:glycosyltransferase involved in cell wall biosynthesis